MPRLEKRILTLSAIDIWDTVTVEEIDGCDPIDRLRHYIGENK